MSIVIGWDIGGAHLKAARVNCVRRAFLLGDEQQDRKSWIERRLQELADIFAVSVGGFAILDNHLHLLVQARSGAGPGLD